MLIFLCKKNVEVNMLLRAYPNIYYRTFIHHSGRTDFFPPAFVRKPRQSAAIPAFSSSPGEKPSRPAGAFITSLAPYPKFRSRFSQVLFFFISPKRLPRSRSQNPPGPAVHLPLARGDFHFASLVKGRCRRSGGGIHRLGVFSFTMLRSP